MARKQFHVVPRGSLWQVTDAAGVRSNHLNKSDAIDAGVAMAKQNQPSQLLIHRANGTIEDERTYGQDPYPPRG